MEIVVMVLVAKLPGVRVMHHALCVHSNISAIDFVVTGQAILHFVAEHHVAQSPYLTKQYKYSKREFGLHYLN